MLANGMDRLQHLARAAGPYLLLELFMPGGTLVALLLYWWKRRGAAAVTLPTSPASSTCG
jgi:hypothetical protein